MALTLSSAQQQVVDLRGSDLQVIACAGSGKTESISRRVASLIGEGADPSSIVAFTFTERSATELKERITRRVAERMGIAYCDRLGPLFIGTIHAFCLRLLQEHVPHFGNYDVLNDHRHVGLLLREHRRLGLRKLKAHRVPIREFLRTVDVIANERIAPASLVGTPLGECYQAYKAALDRYHFLTFGLIITSAIEALEDPDVYARVHGALRYLLVDEYQDINPAQEELIRLLAQKPVELTVVGDDDQAIYQWRGSDVRNILEFRERRPSAAGVTLKTNRRSRPTIVSVANIFAESIPQRLLKRMEAVREEGPAEVVPWIASTDDAEADLIGDTIERLKGIGYAYRDVAVLFRSVRTSGPAVIAALSRRGIPYTTSGRTGLFVQPEVAVIAEIYAWFVNGEWRDDPYGEFRPADLTRIVEGLHRIFNNGEAIPELKAYLEDWQAFVLRGHRPVNLVGDYYRLLRKLGVYRWDPSVLAASARMGALARFSEVLGDFEHVNRRGRQVDVAGSRIFEASTDRGREYFRALHNYLLHYARDAYEEFDGEVSVDFDAVDVLTIHQAKGLEWPIVFMPALVQGRFPSRRAGQCQDWLLPDSVFPEPLRTRYEGGDAEERRLFYVGLTRARDAVYLSAFERKINRFLPSEYLLEVTGEPLPLLGELPLPGLPAGISRETSTLDVSFSDLATFAECGYRYRLANLFGFQTQIAPELGYGRAVHHVLRLVAEGVRGAIRVPSSDEIDEIVNNEFFVPFASLQAWETMRRAARRLVTTYIGAYASDLCRVWAAERPFILNTEHGTVSGRADVILDAENGRREALAIVDYKVANDQSRDARYDDQLRAYVAAGTAEGLEIKAAYLHELRDGTRRPVDIAEPAMQAGMRSLAERVAALRRSEFVAQPERTRCQRCEYHAVCAHSVADDQEMSN
jgi:DNA helicase II / ATP-dependent DNA helicase PcrA